MSTFKEMKEVGWMVIASMYGDNPKLTSVLSVGEKKRFGFTFTTPMDIWGDGLSEFAELMGRQEAQDNFGIGMLKRAYLVENLGLKGDKHSFLVQGMNVKDNKQLAKRFEFTMGKGTFVELKITKVPNPAEHSILKGFVEGFNGYLAK